MSTILFLAILLSLSFVYARHALQMFQQNHYELYRYSKWLFSKNNIRVSSSFIFIIFILLFGTFLPYKLFIYALALLFAIYVLYKENEKVYIKDLVLTARVKRQIVVLSVVMVLLYLANMRVFPADFCVALAIIDPYVLIYPLALLTYPLEEAIKKHYENEARGILEQYDHLLKIGITGSFGKTSTKNIINEVIADERFTLMTPASYNTPMGITRTIRELLKPIHEVFICEMGADKAGDITYLMDFVKPQYGVVTSIGPQHLNTFGSIENIVREKMQEVELLPADGVAFINLDNEYIAEYEISNTCKVVSVGIDNQNADYVAEDVSFSKDGSGFSMKIKGRKYKFTTSLLGKHNITNILLGIAIALELGIDEKTVVRNVAAVRQIEHRLQVRKINGFTFIDDSFNANPVGSKRALDVLALMDGQRVIVTPGMIDLGARQEELNKEFGAYMKDKADQVILVGEKQSKPIYEGLEESGFVMENVRVVSDVREAFAYVYSHFSGKDTILLENDLPDAFNV